MKSKQYYTIILLILFSLERQNANAQAPNCIWAKAIGGPEDDVALSIALDPDGSGDVYATGYFSGTVDFDPGDEIFNLSSTFQDVFIFKLDGSGNFVWAKSLKGTNGNGYGKSIGIDPREGGGIYITGRFEGTVDFDPGPGVFNMTPPYSHSVFISKLDRSGNFIWAKAIWGAATGNNCAVSSLDVDPGSGDIYTTGDFLGTVDFDPGAGVFNLTSVGNKDIFIAKFDGDGNFLWVKSMGGINSCNSYAIAVDPTGSGDVYTTGDFNEELDFDPGEDTFYLTSAGDDDIFISKLDGSGNFLWAKSIGGPYSDYSYSIAVDSKGGGGIYTTGYFEETGDFDPGEDTFNLTSVGFYDIFISKLDRNGNFVWAIAQGGIDGGAGGISIKIDPVGSGDIYSTGIFFGAPVDFDPGSDTFNLTAVGGGDIFISKLSDSGNFRWAKSMGGYNHDYGLSIALDGIGNINVAGYFESPDFMADTILLNAPDSTENIRDIFIVKLDMTTATINIDSKAHQISIYPNPATNELTIEFDRIEYFDIQTTLYNLSGQMVYSMADQHVGKRKTIEISALPPGVYFIDVKVDGNRIVRKVVK